MPDKPARPGQAAAGASLALESDPTQVSLAFFTALRARRFDDALQLLADDGTHWGGSYPYREHSLAGFKAKLRTVEQGIHDTPMDFVAVDWFAHGDRVVMEVRNDGTLPDGRRYEMVYCFILTIRGGRIVAMREYADTAYNRDMRPELYSRQSPVYQNLQDLGLDASTFDHLG